MFVKLTLQPTNENIWINSNEIAWFEKCKDSGECTEITMSRGSLLWVKETPNEVAKLLFAEPSPPEFVAMADGCVLGY